MAKQIYLDYSASTPVDPKVLRAMLPYFKREYGNPSSIHTLGQKALAGLDEARKSVAGFLGCLPKEIVFTGSATEANNFVIKGLAENGKLRIITTEIEHHAVLEPCRILERQGVRVTYLPVTDEGIIRVSDVKKAINDNLSFREIILVSVMYANNEIGTIQPIQEIGKIIKDINKKQSVKNKVYFHTDAVQAVNYLDCNVEKLGVDFFTLSAHKIYGPKGVGSIYIKMGTPIVPLIYGGGHEFGLRAGTENVPGIVGLEAAIIDIQKDAFNDGDPKIRIKSIIIKKLRERLIRGLLKSIPDSKLNGSKEMRLPNNINISFPGAEGEALSTSLNYKGIAVSTGSACSVKDLELSHVLLALGISEKEAQCSLRFTLGKYTTQKEIDKVLRVLPSIVERLRKISGYK